MELDDEYRLLEFTSIEHIDEWCKRLDKNFRYKTGDVVVNPTTFEPVVRTVKLPNESSPSKTAFILKWCR